jgi:hypothetical protein
MTLINAIKKLENSGFNTENIDGIYRASSSTAPRVIEFFRNGHSKEITCINVRRPNDHHDSMTDYSAGSWANNITQAIRIAIS